MTMTMTLARNTIKCFDKSSPWNPRRNQAWKSTGFVCKSIAEMRLRRERRPQCPAARPWDWTHAPPGGREFAASSPSLRSLSGNEIIIYGNDNDFDEEYN